MPLAALGTMLDGSRLSTCLLRLHKVLVPVADISAPESESTFIVFEPLVEQIWTVIVSAGSVNLSWWTPDNSGLSAVMAVSAPVVFGWGL